MNVQNLRDNYPKLIFYMETNSYSKTYVNRLKREIEKILLTVDSKGWSCYTDVYLEYTKTSRSPDYLRNKRLSSEPLISLMFMVDTQMEDAGMNFSKEVLIRCYYQNPSLRITVKQKRNVARKLPPFIQNLIIHLHFSYPSSKKELIV